MLSIHCHDVTKRFQRVDVLDRVRWHVDAGKVVGLLGGSGVGKTTLLRLIAGLTRCTSGNIAIGDLPAERRRIGMVFQNLALWPHLTARDHLRCVLFDHPARDRQRRAEALLTELRLPAAVWNNRPAQLSGGEAQRLALARALAVEPNILLLDEPLAHLDPPLRAELIELLRACVGSRRTTCVFVTHSWDEAAAICERIAVLDRGRLVQEGTPADLYWRPANEHVAHWTGPYIEVPTAWLRGGNISAAQDASQLGITPVTGEKLVVRPQQLVAVSATDRNRWTVVEQRPMSGGWWATVTRDRDKLSLFLRRPSTPGEVIGLELRLPSDCAVPGSREPAADESL